MADTYPPFMNAYNNIVRILEKVKEAKTPPRFTQDFLESKLGASGGSARPFIPFAKRLGFLSSDGTPTELYKRFRNPSQSGAAVAEALRIGYADLYDRNEYLHELNEDDLTGLIVEATGLSADSKTLRAIVKSFMNLRELADFDSDPSEFEAETTQVEEEAEEPPEPSPPHPPELRGALNFGYTINLNLPATDDPAVHDAIFKALRENLLR